jgi:hypothetical protein
VKRGQVFNSQEGGTNNGGKGGEKGSHAATITSIHRTIAALSNKFNKFIIPDDDLEDSYEEEEGSPNRSNQALAHQSKKKNKRS